MTNNCPDCEALWQTYTEARRTFLNLRRAALSAPAPEGSARKNVVQQVQNAETSLDEAREKLTQHMGRAHKQ